MTKLTTQFFIFLTLFFPLYHVNAQPTDIVALPLDFESTTIDYAVGGFGAADLGAIPVEVGANPDQAGENASAMALKITKPEGAQVWAGASIPLGEAIDPAEGAIFSMKVWSPRANVPVLLKFEDTNSPRDANGNLSIFAEIMVNTTVAGAWETLTYNMAQHPGFVSENQFNQIAIFPDFGNMGAAGGEDFYIDDIQATGTSAGLVELPLDFEATDLTYTVFGFGAADLGAIPAEVGANPDQAGENMSATALKVTKPEGAQVWAGASIALGTVIDLSAGPLFSMKVWAPRAGTPIQLKFEDTTSPLDANGNPSIISEVIVNTTMAGAWETLTYDMSSHPGYDAANQYNQVIVFPDFGNVGVAGGEDFYFDDIQSAGGENPMLPMLPIDFESMDLTYTVFGFGAADLGAIPAEVGANPDQTGENTSMTALKVTKPEGAQVWAGASMPLSGVIDLSNGPLFTLKVWAPRAGTPIQLKFEDTTSPLDANGNPSIISEVIVNTTMAGAWETLTYDMSSHPGYDVANQYNQVIIFPDFGNMGVAGGEDYYFDDIQSAGGENPMLPMLPIDFESMDLTYTVFGFGAADLGAIPAEVGANPDQTGENTSMTALKVTKPEGAQVWAGASMPLSGVIDLSNGPLFTLKVWAPRAGTPIQLKFEDTTSPLDANGNPSIISEVIVNTTMAGAWETLTYDMSSHPGYDAANQYNQVIIFPDFGNMGVAGGEDYYFDDIQSAGGENPMLPMLPIDFESMDLTYTIFGFGGADLGAIPTEVGTNPDQTGENTSMNALKVTKPEGAQVWAGASIPLSGVIDLSNGPNFSIKVWAPRAGTPIQLKFEDTTSPLDANGNPSIISEVIVNTTMAGAWEILTYDMSSHPGYDSTNQYNQVVVFPDFGNMGVAGGEDFYFDDIQNRDAVSSLDELALISFAVYPNPAHDVLNIQYDLPTPSRVSLSLIDAMGRSIQETPLGVQGVGIQQNRLEVHALVPGNYFLLVKMEGKIVGHQAVIIR